MRNPKRDLKCPILKDTDKKKVLRTKDESLVRGAMTNNQNKDQ